MALSVNATAATTLDCTQSLRKLLPAMISCPLRPGRISKSKCAVTRILALSIVVRQGREGVPAAMPSRGTANPRRGIGVRTRWGWGLSASAEKVGQVGMVLQLSNATVVRNGTPILDAVTMSVRAGEHTAILGPNGAGKTTLINLLTLEAYPLAPTNGQGPPVRVFGRSRWNVFELRSQIGIVPADLHERFVAGNCSGQIRGEDAVISGFFATQGFLRGLNVTDSMREAARRALVDVEAAHLGGKMLDEMSTGEARRVLIARSLVTGPDALVLDEPTAALDVVARRRVLDQVRQIARPGTACVRVAHHVRG